MARIDVTAPSLLLTQVYGALPLNAGEGITVGIIDSGVDGTHPDLKNVSGGLNCVSDETRNNPAAAQNWRPARSEGEHGTHVAGIVGGKGSTSGFRGVAPGVTLRSYRVFPDAGGPASNFDIAKAIDTAVADHCDIINMSLGGGPKDDLTRAAIDRALNAGIVVVAAAGNDDRKPVSFPAALPECVAVSAMGRVGSFPKKAIGTSNILPPKGNPSTKDFIADFSNFGIRNRHHRRGSRNRIDTARNRPRFDERNIDGVAGGGRVCGLSARQGSSPETKSRCRPFPGAQGRLICGLQA